MLGSRFQTFPRSVSSTLRKFLTLPQIHTIDLKIGKRTQTWNWNWVIHKTLLQKLLTIPTCQIPCFGFFVLLYFYLQNFCILPFYAIPFCPDFYKSVGFFLLKNIPGAARFICLSSWGGENVPGAHTEYFTIKTYKTFFYKKYSHNKIKIYSQQSQNFI